MVDQQKKEIRKQIRAIKKTISLEEKKQRSIAILEKLEQLEEFQKAKVVMLYWSMADEVFTHDFALKWVTQKRIILPAVDGSELRFKEFIGMDTMQEGEGFGIMEPVGADFDQAENIDLIVVPGVAFDLQYNRMGRGKAYYDKTLKKLNAFKVGVCFKFQLLNQVPVDQHDIKMDCIITE
ncbi:MAG: 5-formyltetrahydrofolate cyclo-ligase [Bacteroidales bacterium]|nr:5-formyltetrahydrofolate cyclo-ligase [Bacteroidales bacterium]